MHPTSGARSCSLDDQSGSLVHSWSRSSRLRSLHSRRSHSAPHLFERPSSSLSDVDAPRAWNPHAHSCAVSWSIEPVSAGLCEALRVGRSSGSRCDGDQIEVMSQGQHTPPIGGTTRRRSGASCAPVKINGGISCTIGGASCTIGGISCRGHKGRNSRTSKTQQQQRGNRLRAR